MPTPHSASATIPPNVLRTLVSITAAAGVDLRPELSAVGLSPELLGSTELRVSYRQGSTVIRRALELTGDELLGLRAGASEHLTTWGLLGFALTACDSLPEAVRLGVRYQRLAGPMVVWSAAAEPDGFAVRLTLPDPAVDPRVARYLFEESFASVVKLIGLSTGTTFVPEKLEFSFPAPADPALYTEFFGRPVVFGAAANRMVFPPGWASTPMPGRDPVTLAATLELLEAQVAAGRSRQELLEVLAVSLAQSLPSVPSFAEQARRQALSERTLRRRLAECGTTYEAVVDEVRRERVAQLLPRAGLTLREVARQSGFADERALRRAVRRWHGLTPGDLRARLRHAAG